MPRIPTGVCAYLVLGGFAVYLLWSLRLERRLLRHRRTPDLSGAAAFRADSYTAEGQRWWRAIRAQWWRGPLVLFGLLVLVNLLCALWNHLAGA